jgi:transposase
MEYQPRKLSLHHAAKIREYYDQGATQNWLATKFGVSKGTIKLIVQRKTYKEA